MPFPRFFALLGYAVFSIVALVIVLELLAGIGLRLYHAYLPPFSMIPQQERKFFDYCYGTGTGKCRSTGNYELELMSSSPVYRGEPWAEEFWRANRERYQLPPLYAPFVEWQARPWSSTHLNVDATAIGHFRRTLHPQPGCAQPRAIWLFGGSTMFGEGSPDSMTVASALGARLNAAGMCAHVRNFGVEAYNSNQEVILLLDLLRRGHRPDVVVFYDGINDASVGAFTPGVPGGHQYVERIKALLERREPAGWAARSHLVRALRGALHRLGVLEPPQAATFSERYAEGVEWNESRLPAQARATLDNYLENIRTVRALGGQYGFASHFFWQPTLLYGGKPPAPVEAAILRNPELIMMGMGRQGGERYRKAIAAVYDEAQRRARDSRDFIWLAGLFDGNDQPLYIDPIHLGPAGDAMVAEAIAKALLATPAPKP